MTKSSDKSLVVLVVKVVNMARPTEVKIINTLFNARYENWPKYLQTTLLMHTT